VNNHSWSERERERESFTVVGEIHDEGGRKIRRQ
jgi:hypothetical protein